MNVASRIDVDRTSRCVIRETAGEEGHNGRDIVGLCKCVQRKFVDDVGIPLAAGLIVGEALVGVGNDLLIVVRSGISS